MNCCEQAYENGEYYDIGADPRTGEYVCKKHYRRFCAIIGAMVAIAEILIIALAFNPQLVRP